MNRPAMQPPEKQPIGFWTLRAGEALAQRIRSSLEAVGVPQPQWWVLHQLTEHPHGMDQTAMVDRIGPNQSGEVVRDAIEDALEHGRVTREGEILHLTPAGREAFDRAAVVQQQLADERMQGISQEEYVTTITVLQRMCRNVGADVWHW